MKAKSFEPPSWRPPTQTAVILVTLLTTFVPCLIHGADFDGHDTFDDNTKDTELWDADVITGIGQLTETGGRLQYSASGTPMIGDSAGRPWETDVSATNDWEIRVEVHVPEIPMGSAQHYATGLVVVNTAAQNEQIVFMLSNESPPNPDGREFYVLQLNGSGVTYHCESGTTAQDALLRLRWDASTATLSPQFSTDGGKTWTPCGSALQNPFGFEDNDNFGVAVAGYSENMNVSVGDNLYLDNFWAVTEKPVINSLQTTGVLTWTDSLTNAYYTIEWAPTVNGPWYRDWNNLTFHQSASETKQVEVPQFFRVIRE